MNTIKSTVVAATLITACFLLTPQYALAEYVKCNNQVTGTEIGSIEYVSSECTRSDGTTYFQSQTHLDLMSAGANRPSEDPVVVEEVVDVVIVVVDKVVDPKIAGYQAELDQKINDFNRHVKRYNALKSGEQTIKNSKNLPKKLKAVKERIVAAVKEITALQAKLNK